MQHNAADRENVSIHATLAGGDAVSSWYGVPRLVSIHATLAGGDVPFPAWLAPLSCFYPRHPRGWRRGFAVLFQGLHRVSIHATLAGGDLVTNACAIRFCAFLSTPPSRVATAQLAASQAAQNGFYPRHPRGWRRVRNMGCFQPLHVSIHATLAGGDYLRYSSQVRIKTFLSTPPSRVATFAPRRQTGQVLVSIHATLAGGDAYSKLRTRKWRCFYPRHPRGWRRHGRLSSAPRHKSFLSTPPSRVATQAETRHCARRGRFYPRHPRGWRLYLSVSVGGGKSFYPRHPRGWRRIARSTSSRPWRVSIHATLAGGDILPTLSAKLTTCFYPRHPRGWRQAAGQ